MEAKKQFIISLYFFVAIALLGLILRAVPVFHLSINFNNYLHAHSHVAFLGWLHGAFVAFVSFIFLKDKLRTRFFKFIYWFTILNIVGMYFSFPIQGYKAFSIAFLSLFLIGTYFYLYYFFKHKTNESQYPATYKFIKAGLWLQFLSSLSPWSLVFILKLFGKNSNFYKFDIFYYLHFQYNGWFLFALLGLTFYLLERRGITINHKQVNHIYKLMLVSVFFGYFSNTLWAKPGWVFNIISMVGGLAEIVAFLILLRILLRYRRYIQHQISTFSYQILMVVLLLLYTKATLQFIGSLQYYADLSFQIRDFIIGYLHLIMLGIFSPFLLVMGHELGFYRLKRWAFFLFFAGFTVTETLIFTRGIFQWFEWDFDGNLINTLLFYFTLLMFTGIFFLVLNSKNVHKKSI
jgi:hypothetical protein